MSVIRAPYSLGKLIDWKHWLDSAMQHRSTKTPYSLGKLIDWKLELEQHQIDLLIVPFSLLAREIN